MKIFLQQQFKVIFKSLDKNTSFQEEIKKRNILLPPSKSKKIYARLGNKNNFGKLMYSQFHLVKVRNEST